MSKTTNKTASKSKSELKIVYLLYRFPTLSETFILRELEELNSRNVCLSVVSLLDPKRGLVNAVSKDLLSRVRYLPSVVSIAFWWAQCYFLATQPLLYIKLLTTLLAQPYRSAAPKIFAWRCYIFLRAIAAAYLLRKEEFDLLHTHFAAWPGAATWIVSKLLRRPYTITAGHGYDIYTASTLVDLVTPDAEHVISVAEFNRQIVLKMSPRLQESDVTLIPCSIDLNDFAPPVPRQPASCLRLISVGRLVEKKGHHYLVQACARLKARNIPFHCTIIGGGSAKQEQALRLLVQKLGLEEEVTLTGAKPFSEIYTALLQHDLFVLPCVVSSDNDRDATPVVLVEAAATGLPLIASPVGGIADLVVDGVTGLLVPEKDVESLANAIIVLAGNADLRWRLGLNGRQRVEQRFNVHRNITTLIEIFEKAAQQ